jgi:hypothetical protein
MKKSHSILLVTLFGVVVSLNAQITEAEAQLKKKSTATDKVWMKGATTGVNMSQTALINWAAGGQESVSMNAYLNAFANYKKGKWAWDNMLNVGYGVLKQKTDAFYMKTDDKVDILSKIGWKRLNVSIMPVWSTLKPKWTTDTNTPISIRPSPVSWRQPI